MCFAEGCSRLWYYIAGFASFYRVVNMGKLGFVLSVIAIGALVTSLIVNLHQHNIINKLNDDIRKYMLPDHTANFTFTWGPDDQNIVDGTFRMEISAWLENHTNPWDNTTTVMFNWIVRVYDDDYSSGDALGFVYDRNHNGVIDLGHTDSPYLFFANNLSAGYVALFPDGRWAEAEIPRTQANVCRYDSEIGYTFGPFRGPKDYYASKFGDGPTYIPLFITFNDHNPPYKERALARAKVAIQFIIYLD